MSRDGAGVLRSFPAMGVDVSVAGATADEAAAVEALFAEWDGVFSRFRRDSELCRVNSAGADVVAVSPLFARALRCALAGAAATGGLVDPTLGVAIEALGYDRDFPLVGADPRPPAPTPPGCFGRVAVAGRLVRRPRDVAFDLNGVVKALAVDNSLALIAGDGFVCAGKDLAARGPVTVGLPDGESIRLVAGALATSGTTHRRWLRGGRVQHHLLDPRTGLPAASRWSAVTVAGADCVAADVAAKAAFLLSGEGPEWLDERGLPGRFAAGDEIVENAAWTAAMTGGGERCELRCR